LRIYEEHLKSQEAKQRLIDAPGGAAHEAAIKEHGPVRGYSVDVEGMGRHRLTLRHADGE
jgi:hypothetical protein